MANSTNAVPKVTFWGAARTVTGSMHLIEANGFRLLLDCGLYQGRRDEARERNSHFPFNPRDINAVLLSHAHIDHCGNLPNLVRQGFDGPIYCTPATADLAKVMLLDSAKIQEEDAFHLNRKRPPNSAQIQPLYDRKDAHRTAQFFHGVPYDRPQNVERDIQFRFVEAGHIIGSAMVAVTFRSAGRDYALTFTGDLGRRGLPILRDPAPVPPASLLISESTYGGQTHGPVNELADNLAQIVRRTVERGGKLLIPAFSLGRTQTLIYYFHQLITAKKLSPLPIYVDSPLACDATQVFRLHPECFDEETTRLLDDDPNLFGGRQVHYLHSVEESKELNSRQEPCVIIAASGMCEAGRILHHLKHHVEDPRTTVLLAGHQAPETLGRRLMDKRPEVRIFDRIYHPKAEVIALSGFSSHADQQDFDSFLGPLAGKVRHVRLVHGELDRSEALAQSLKSKGFADIVIPDRGESFTMD
jgi:metallo-beta-lactamase family protein